MIKKIKVSVISYLNTAPFVYGLTNTEIANYIDLSFDTPALCADRIRQHDATIGIIPVAAIPSIPDSKIITPYCIGAVGKVHSVAMLCDVDINCIDTLYLDADSRTSAQLVQLLLKHHWKHQLEIKPLHSHAAILQHRPNEAFLLIGDKVFTYEKYFGRLYDLAEEWIGMTSLPFVFANWVSTIELEPRFMALFEAALRYGLQHKEEAIRQFKSDLDAQFCLHYLNTNISYELDTPKQQGQALFLKMLKQLIINN